MDRGGIQRAPISTLPPCGPGAWSSQGKAFTAVNPPVDKYRPDYYSICTDYAGGPASTSVLRDDAQVLNLAPKTLASPFYKVLKAEESLAKHCLSVLSYSEHCLFALSGSLAQTNTNLSEDATAICDALQIGLRHAIALSSKLAANAVLKRRDKILAEAKSLRDTQLVSALRTAPLEGPFLFQDSLEEALKSQQNIDSLYSRSSATKSSFKIPRKQATAHASYAAVGQPSLPRGTSYRDPPQRGQTHSTSRSTAGDNRRGQKRKYVPSKPQEASGKSSHPPFSKRARGKPRRK